MRIQEFLDQLRQAEPWLVRCGFADLATAHRNLQNIAQLGVPLGLVENLVRDLGQYLPGSADPDRALNNLERFLKRCRSPLAMLSFLERQPHSLAILFQLFAASQFFSELIIDNPEYFDLVWEHGTEPVDPVRLKDELLAEIRALHYQHDQVLSVIRRRRSRELLRIGFRDIVAGQPLDQITRSISDLADAVVETALSVAYRKQSLRFGEPRSSDGKYSRMVVMGLGKLGGQELNYSSDIDLIILYEEDGQTDGKLASTPNSVFFAGVVQEMVNMLSASTAHGFAYRVDLRLRPHGREAPLCQSLRSTLAYYDRHGRTWERQALVKARPVAGYKGLGQRFLDEIERFVYRRYLSFVEINEIKSIKRQIELKSDSHRAGAINVKTGRGGIRDIEFIVQFLQLLNGGVNSSLRENNTLRSLRLLVDTGCINNDEFAALETAYRFLRKTEHRLQFMFDLQRHTIPESTDELDKLAMRLGYTSGSGVRPGEEFLSDLHAIKDRNNHILRHLMTDLFPPAAGQSTGETSPESDLILDPLPPTERIEAVLSPYRFNNVARAYETLLSLGVEEIPFLSTIRCRHFLASIAPWLLRTLSEGPDPDMALINLEKVTSSLGAKGVLWESFSQNPPMLKLYVNLCAWSQYLSEILINSPGMIDELLDTLIMNRPPLREMLEAELDGLLKGAQDIEPILHSFKSTRLLEIGVHDILGKAELHETLEDLSDLAEVIVGAIVQHHFQQMIDRYGEPIQEQDRSKRSEFALVGLGKLGGAELGYHGDLDLVLLYQADGQTKHGKGSRGKQGLSNFDFYTELLQRVIKTASSMTAGGKLYSIDLRLRPMGRSGSLASPLFRFEEYFATSASIWERQAMLRARVIYGSKEFSPLAERGLRQAAIGSTWKRSMIDDVVQMRHRLESGKARSQANIKRGRGGEADVEFAVQLAQLRFGRECPAVLEPNTWRAIDALERTGHWSKQRAAIFREGYKLLRLVESRLRIVYNLARNDIPEDSEEQDKLAQRSGYNSGPELLAELASTMESLRKEFLSTAADLAAEK
ncbi:bifunctional [glutamate--ammonia ligase]-adenylyl-L-tyrosine phosphorylase/[glutamate--ammonia-ligase] adenylyltransferase [bacterium]|nr:bifunctional [glutamate--ammonia ligase]-adenylyl-L-tyrosine phosphorylase/[glutamate--ammonia-ligase] adenylyltransferase [bacterium]